MVAVQEVLSGCGCSTESDLPALTCDALERVQTAAGAKILDLMKCIGGPRKVGDEQYDYAGDVEALFRIMRAAHKFCELKRPKAYTAVARSQGGCHSNACGPSVEALEKRWKECCSAHPRILLGG